MLRTLTVGTHTHTHKRTNEHTICNRTERYRERESNREKKTRTQISGATAHNLISKRIHFQLIERSMVTDDLANAVNRIKWQTNELNTQFCFPSKWFSALLNPSKIYKYKRILCIYRFLCHAIPYHTMPYHGYLYICILYIVYAYVTRRS